MKLLASAVVVAALLLLSNAHASSRIFWTLDRVETHRLVKERDAWKRSAKLNARLARRYQRVLRHDANVREAIGLASVTFHVSSAEMWSVAGCETGGTYSPRAKNRHSTASGLFQWLYPSSWRSTPFQGFSVWSPYASAMAAAWTRRQDGSWRQWQCQP